jgi:hypothetical protein
VRWHEVGIGPMQQASVSHPCELSAQEYWKLKNDPRWDAYCDSLDRNERSIQSLEQAGSGWVTSTASVQAKVNPIPVAVRRMLGLGPEFSFTITETWHRELYDAAHAAKFQTTPAVLPSKIKVGGRHWVEDAQPSGCILHFELEIKVGVVGIGTKLAKGIATSTIDAYSLVPSRALEFRRQQGGAAACSSSSYPSAGSTATQPVPLARAQPRLNGTSRALAEAAVQISAAEDFRISALLCDDADALGEVEAMLPPEGRQLIQDTLARFTAHMRSLSTNGGSGSKDHPKDANGYPVPATSVAAAAAAAALHARHALVAFSDLLLLPASEDGRRGLGGIHLPANLPCCGARSKALLSVPVGESSHGKRRVSFRHNIESPAPRVQHRPAQAIGNAAQVIGNATQFIGGVLAGVEDGAAAEEEGSAEAVAEAVPDSVATPLALQLNRAQRDIAELRARAEELILSSMAAEGAPSPPFAPDPPSTLLQTLHEAKSRPVRARPRGRDRADDRADGEADDEAQRDAVSAPLLPGWRGDRFVV